MKTWADQEGGGDRGSGPPPPEKSQKYSFIAILDRHRYASETPHIVVFGSSLLSLTLKNNVVKVGPLLAKLSGSAHGTGSPLFAYRIMVYQNLNKKWKIPPNEISCQISAVYGQLHERAKTSMCIQHCFWLLKSQYDRSPAKSNFHRNRASNHERQVFSLVKRPYMMKCENLVLHWLPLS